MASSIDVIVPVYGNWHLTERLLEALGEQTVEHRVTIVDNGSRDEPPQVVAARRSVDLIRLSENAGFAAACNRGLRATGGEFALVVNNDIVPGRDFLARLIAPFDDPRIGSVAPLLLRPDGAIDSVGLCVDITLAGFPRLQGKPPEAAAEAEPLLLGPAGAAAGYRRSALNQVGGFDEQIFMYQEDLDLALRLRTAGWKTTSVTDTTAVHLGSATAARRSPWQRRTSGFSRGYLLRRYGILRSRHAARALVTELAVIAGDSVVSRDLSALRGRAAGFSAARRTSRRPVPSTGIDRSIGMMRSLRLRREDYAVAAR